MVQLPEELRYDHESLPYTSILASYEKGIRYGAFNSSRLKVWGLTQSTEGRLNWVLTYEANLNSHARTMYDKWVSEDRQPKRQWEVKGLMLIG